MLIRKTTPEDVPLLPAVESAADEAFLTLPELAWVARDGGWSEDEHRKRINDGYSIVAVDEQNSPVGFLIAERRGSESHIQGLAVARAIQGRGVGRALLNRAIADAQKEGVTAMTLTTFRNVPWNQPFYERAGFRVLEESELDARLKAVLLAEAAHGFAYDTRCAMRLSLAQRQP
ncbi:GNAT family N-acetyltransferase [Franconibacter pulveris 601]|uniref:GNAT family N-acetyltransferase n=1 Tax=Franconibacter pulveris TaxID=435910 RepID=UPI000A8DB9D1|nr:GNAT family N-acetyltransferase [Franconibacter pulveris]